MMRCNIIFGTAIIPLLARIVLCAAFITTGWNKLMNVDEFKGESADRLIERGVDDIVRVLPPSHEPAVEHHHDDEAAPQGEEAAADAVDWQALFPAGRPEANVYEDPETGERVLIAKRLHHVTLILIDAGCEGRWPVRLAWLLAITEFVGGTLLLLGLFSRVWGLALAIAMIGAFWLTSVPVLLEVGGPFAIAEDVDAFHGMYAQLGLLVLALAVFLVGPGPLSLDRLIFKHRPAPVTEEYVIRRHDTGIPPNTGPVQNE